VPRSIAAFFLLFLAVLAAAPPALSQKAGPPTLTSHDNERQSFAINVLHAINNAEFDYKTKHGTYATWQTLVAEGDFNEHGTKFISEDAAYTAAHALYGLGPEIVPGWKLRLNISNNGKSYDAQLEDVTDPKCNYAAVTDERGVIRQSKSIACPL
jgi:hypothetical protein